MSIGKGQEVCKKRFEEQKKYLEEAGAQKILTDGAKRSKKTTALQKIMDGLKPGDTIIIPSIDRVSLSARDFLGFCMGVRTRGAVVKILNMGILDDSQEGKTLLRIISAFADLEKEALIERTQRHHAEAREDIRFREGRPKKYSKQDLDKALKMLKTSSYSKVASATGISVSTLQRAHRREKALREHTYSMTDAEVREYEATVDGSKQLDLTDFF